MSSHVEQRLRVSVEPSTAPPVDDDWAETCVDDVRFLDEGEFFKSVGFCLADEPR